MLTGRCDFYSGERPIQMIGDFDRTKALKTTISLSVGIFCGTRFGTTLGQIPVVVAVISGPEGKYERYLHRTGSGTGHSAGLQGFRIISTPLGCTPKVVLGLFASSKNRRGAMNHRWS